MGVRQGDRAEVSLRSADAARVEDFPAAVVGVRGAGVWVADAYTVRSCLKMLGTF